MIGRYAARLARAGLTAALLARGAGLAAALLIAGAIPAAAHHVGAYVPRDNEVSANFKQIKFAIQAGKFDVARRLFESGAVRAEMRAQSSRLPGGLEESTRAALERADARAAERSLMIFFVALARDLALEAERRVTDAGASADARLAAGRKFLEAIWRYYNLVDFAVTQYDAKAGVAIRLAFDEAEGFVKDPANPANPAPAASGAPARPTSVSDPARLREPLHRLSQTLSGLIETSSTSQRRGS